MKLKIYFIIAVLCFTKNYSQNSNENCKVLLPSISQQYKGKCTNGLADGKGEAKGEDNFVGSFKDGLPDGKGKYIFQNGSTFEGNWNMGKKEGEGKYTFLLSGKKMVQKGFWLNDEYFGNTNPNEYFVIKNKTNVPYYNFVRKDDTQNKLNFSILKSNVKYVPINFVIKTSSGTIINGLKEVNVSDFILPLHCEIEYVIIKSGTAVTCSFAFDVNKAGNYELQLTND